MIPEGRARVRSEGLGQGSRPGEVLLPVRGREQEKRGGRGGCLPVCMPAWPIEGLLMALLSLSILPFCLSPPPSLFRFVCVITATRLPVLRSPLSPGTAALWLAWIDRVLSGVAFPSPSPPLSSPHCFVRHIEPRGAASLPVALSATPLTVVPFLFRIASHRCPRAHAPPARRGFSPVVPLCVRFSPSACEPDVCRQQASTPLPVSSTLSTATFTPTPPDRKSVV